jgi:serine/threonine protein kinase
MSVASASAPRPITTEVKDYIGLATDADVDKMVKKWTKGASEKVFYSGRIVKITSKGRWNLRILMVTDKAIYNLSVSSVGTCKRRILIENVTGVTASRLSSEVVLHVPTEYDFRFQTFHKGELIDVVKAIFKGTTGGDIEVKWVYDFFLGHLTNTRENVMNNKVATTREQALMQKKGVVNSNTPSGDHGDEDDEDDQEDDNKIVDEKEIVEEVTLTNTPAEEGLPPNSGPPRKVTIEDFDLLKVLGRGAFGKVMQVRKKDTGKIYAMKILKKNMVYQRKQVAHTQAERKILEAAQHPFLMGLRFAFQSDTKLYLLMDFYKGGELFFHLQKKKRFTEDEARIIVAEVALALGHLHTNSFIYRDLKPENILMHESGHVCLTDFGLAKELDPDQKEARTMCGTPEYLPPEVLTGKKHNKNVDWWGLGVLIYELTTGVTPFHSSTMESLVRKAEKGVVKFPKHLTEECKDIISQLLQVNPKMRIGASEADIEEIKQHKWFAVIDWDKLMRKEINAVYIPPVEAAETFSDNFDAEFTSEPVVDSVVPDNMIKAIPKEAGDFNQWTFVGDDNPMGKKGADIFKKHPVEPEDDGEEPDMKTGSFDEVDKFLKKK